MKFSAPDLDQLAQDWILTDKLNLPSRPTIVVAGCFEGKLIRLLAELYPDHHSIHGFDAQMWASMNAQEGTKHLPRVVIHHYGLLAAHGEATLPMGEFYTDACSLFASTRDRDSGRFADAVDALGDIPTAKRNIDLFVVNMEGYEYKLLPYLRGQGMLSWIDRLAVQFHAQYADIDAGITITSMDHFYRRAIDNFPQWVYWVRQNA